MAKLRIKVEAVTKGAKKGFKRIVEMAKNAKKRMGKIPLWGQFAGAIGLTSAVSRITSTLIDSVSAARRFQRQMSEINTIARLSSRGIALMKKQVIGLSLELGVTTDTLTGGLYEALSAGVPQNNAIDFLRVATKASIAGVTSVTVAVDGLTSVLNAYKMDSSEAERVSDIFFETIRLGKTKFDQLSDSIGLVLPMANAAGVSFTELGAAFATMTKQGLSTDKSATALRGIMQDLINPSEALILVMQQIEKELGISSIRSLDFQEQIALIGKKASDTGQNLSDLFENVRAFTGALQLMGRNAKEAARDLDTIRMGVGSMEKAYKQFAGTADRELAKIERSWEKVKRKVGEWFMRGVIVVLSPVLDTDAEKKIQARLDKSKFTIHFLGEKEKILEEQGLKTPTKVSLLGLDVVKKESQKKLLALRKLMQSISKEIKTAEQGTNKEYLLRKKLIELHEKELRLKRGIKAATELKKAIPEMDALIGKESGLALIDLIAKEIAMMEGEKGQSDATKDEIKGLEILRTAIIAKNKADETGALKTAEIKSAAQKSLEAAKAGLKEQIALATTLNTKGKEAAFIQDRLNKIRKAAPFQKLTPKEEKELTKELKELYQLKQGKMPGGKAGLFDEKKEFTQLQLVGANLGRGAGVMGDSGSNQKRNILLDNIKAGIWALRTDAKKPPTLFDKNEKYV